MPDPRWDALAEILIDHSTRLGRGRDAPDRVLRPRRQHAAPPARAEGRAQGGAARWSRPRTPGSSASWSGTARRRRCGPGASSSCTGWSGCRPTSRLRGARNINEMADVPAEKMNLYNTHLPEAGPLRVADQADPRGASSACPTPSMAQQAGHEHRGVRGLLLRRLQPRLPAAGQGASSPWSSGWTAAREVHITGPGDRPAVLDRRDPGRPLRRAR